MTALRYGGQPFNGQDWAAAARQLKAGSGNPGRLHGAEDVADIAGKPEHYDRSGGRKQPRPNPGVTSGFAL